MLVEYRAKSMEPNKYSETNISVQEVTECPRCKKAIKPQHLNSIYKKTNENSAIMENHLFCSGCNSSFIVHYDLRMQNNKKYSESSPSYVAPNMYVEYSFEKEISEISPQFVKIYNQALSAESFNLDEIAGLGYRKSLEFLVKDFAISENPDEEENIKNMMLSPCIQKYIDNPQIKTLVTKSTWIGNDEAHYVRKQKDRDITDMKKFIKATVYFISMFLITKDAETIEKK